MRCFQIMIRKLYFMSDFHVVLMVVLCINIYTYMYNSLTLRHIFFLRYLKLPAAISKGKTCVC